MSLAAPRRGRPKGTGIDDQSQLLRIAAMIEANPDMKPTTAIKALGINDPSVIRRLRDKFHAFATDLPSAAPDQPPADAAPLLVPSPASKEPSGRGAAIALAARTTYARKSAARASEPQPAQPEPAAAEPSPNTTPSAVTTRSGDPAMATSAALAAPLTDAAAAWLGMGLAAFASAISAQMALTQGAFRNPFVEIVIRQQLACQQMALAMAPRRPAATH